MEHMKIFVMENPFSPTRCKKIAHIHFIYFKSMIQNHHNPRHTFQTFSLTTYVFLMLVVRALESYLILDKRVEIFLKFYDRFSRVTFRYKEVISLVTTSETNDDNTLVLFSTRPKPFLIAFGSLITNYYTEKKSLLFHEKKLRSRHVSRGLKKLISTICFPNSFAFVIQRGLPRCLISFFFLKRLMR